MKVIQILSVPDEGYIDIERYFRNSSCVLNLISTFLLHKCNTRTCAIIQQCLCVWCGGDKSQQWTGQWGNKCQSRIKNGGTFSVRYENSKSFWVQSKPLYHQIICKYWCLHPENSAFSKCLSNKVWGGHCATTLPDPIPLQYTKENNTQDNFNSLYSTLNIF